DASTNSTDPNGRTDARTIFRIVAESSTMRILRICVRNSYAAVAANGRFIRSAGDFGRRVKSSANSVPRGVLLGSLAFAVTFRSAAREGFSRASAARLKASRSSDVQNAPTLAPGSV